MKVDPRRKKRTKTSKWTLDLKSASIVRPRRMRHTSKERLEPRQIWCVENDKQRRKDTTPVERLCEYDKFRDSNWGE